MFSICVPSFLTFHVKSTSFYKLACDHVCKRDIVHCRGNAMFSTYFALISGYTETMHWNTIILLEERKKEGNRLCTSFSWSPGLIYVDVIKLPEFGKKRPVSVCDFRSHPLLWCWSQWRRISLSQEQRKGDAHSPAAHGFLSFFLIQFGQFIKCYHPHSEQVFTPN